MKRDLVHLGKLPDRPVGGDCVKSLRSLTKDHPTRRELGALSMVESTLKMSTGGRTMIQREALAMQKELGIFKDICHSWENCQRCQSHFTQGRLFIQKELFRVVF